MALTIEDTRQLVKGKELVYLGTHKVEFVRRSQDPEADGPGACYVKVTEVLGVLLHAEFKAGDVILAAPSELSFP